MGGYGAAAGNNLALLSEQELLYLGRIERIPGDRQITFGTFPLKQEFFRCLDTVENRRPARLIFIHPHAQIDLSRICIVPERLGQAKDRIGRRRFNILPHIFLQVWITLLPNGETGKYKRLANGVNRNSEWLRCRWIGRPPPRALKWRPAIFPGCRARPLSRLPSP
ncbi:MAG: hypothetical protein ACD_75C02323G0002 [uncultured bacterium]|nr:MAG: hypothetical protein ACD_75C02323G0002 [uncultured bacterium]